MASRHATVRFGSPAPLTPTSISGRKVLDQHGNVYLMKCLASWGMSQVLSDAEITTALEDTAANGFNAVLVALAGSYNLASEWHQYENDAGEAYWTGTPWNSSLGPGWATIDHIVSECARLGMVTCLSFMVALDDTGMGPDIVAVSNANMTTAGTAIATRYLSATNIVWHVDFDDGTGPGDTRGQRIQAAFAGINATESPARVVRWMENGQNNSTDSLGWFEVGNFNCSTNCMYDYDGESVEIFEATWAQTSAPTGDCEPRYVGNPYLTGTNVQQLRERAYTVFIEGGWLINWGHEDWWTFGLDNPYGGDGETWKTVHSDTETVHASFCWTLVDTYCKDATWAPTSSFVTTGQGSGDTKAAQGFSDTAALAYFPSSRTIAVDTTILAGTANVRLRWFDPTNNTYSSIAASEAQQSGRSVTHPGNNSTGQGDWVLVVDLA
jgi:hypothetical protein